MVVVTGDVDHGKTALVQVLTGMETDWLAEEKRRGISITLGVAHLRMAGVTIDLIEMPGHERFVRTMDSGVTRIDAVLMVVAANQGVTVRAIDKVQKCGVLLRHKVIGAAKRRLTTLLRDQVCWWANLSLRLAFLVNTACSCLSIRVTDRRVLATPR